MQQLDYRASQSIAIFVGAIPFVVWRFCVYTIWPDYSVIVYLLTAYLILGLRVGYPGPGNLWYWKSILASVVLHCIAFTIGAVAIVATRIKPPTLVFFGVGTVILIMESQARVRFFQIFSPKTGPAGKRHES